MTTALSILLGLLAGVCLPLAAPRVWRAVRPLVCRLLGGRWSWCLLGGPWREMRWRFGRWRRGRGPCGVCGQQTNELLPGAGNSYWPGPDGKAFLYCPKCATRTLVGPLDSLAAKRLDLGLIDDDLWDDY